jgi:hypothetical protein
MSRLIDADLLMRKCEKWLKPKAPDEDEMVSVADIAVSTLMEIEEQPTAFDVEKVVEELENLREVELSRPDMCGELGDGDGEAQYNDGVSQGRYEAFIEAIKIVKRGGRDE